jgi:hypothetical protein
MLLGKTTDRRLVLGEINTDVLLPVFLPGTFWESPEPEPTWFDTTHAQCMQQNLSATGMLRA